MNPRIIELLQNLNKHVCWLYLEVLRLTKSNIVNETSAICFAFRSSRPLHTLSNIVYLEGVDIKK